ncbi:MAG: TIGR01906 family membrane protein [Nanoarchaeota archaeon]|mgnify:CR=1 FL=1
MQLNKLLKILFVISLVLLIVTLNFKLLALNFNYYQKEFSKLNVYDKIPEADKFSLNLINYYKDKEELSNFFNEKEKLHLNDIKELIRKGNLLFYLSLILVILFLIYFIYTKNYKAIYSSFLISSLILIIFILVIFLTNFQDLFTKFHLLIFNNDLWLLNPETDNLINLFPLQFFYDIYIKAGVNILISAFILIILSLVIRFKSKQKIFK